MAAKKKAVRKIARSAKKSARKTVNRKPVAVKKLKGPGELRIGQRYAEYGGVYMGVAIGENTAHNYMVFRGRYADKRLNHADARKFASECKDGKFKDWELPGRTAGALLYANGRTDARSGWHWLEPQHAQDDDSAWCQDFSNGYQLDYRKSYELEVVLVRRVLIQ